MKHIGLFEGIGGFSESIEAMGWETIAWCEWNEFGQYVLSDKYPNAIAHGDITKTDFTVYRGKCDIVTGGFPCQPYSTAGKRLGKDDERHLWPEMLRAIREIGPRYVVGENVSGLISWNGGLVFDEVQADLEAAGYEVIPFVLPAAGVGAPHRRDRVWFVAFNANSRASNGNGQEQKVSDTDKSSDSFRVGEIDATNADNFTPNPRLQRPAERQQQPMGPEQLCEERNVAIPGALEAIGERNIRPVLGEGGENGQRDELCAQYDATPHPDSKRNGSKYGFCSGGQMPEKCTDSERTAADTTGEGYEKRQSDNRWQNTAEDRTGVDDRPERFGQEWITANPDSTGRTEECQPAAQPGEQERQYSETHFRSGPGCWQNFPTQSPVCARNDGLSTESLRQRIREDSMGYLSEKEIDKIISAAATQWRNESIKAAGNAIVPQVFLQICKAIQLFDQKGYTV